MPTSPPAERKGKTLEELGYTVLKPGQSPLQVPKADPAALQAREDYWTSVVAPPLIALANQARDELQKLPLEQNQRGAIESKLEQAEKYAMMDLLSEYKLAKPNTKRAAENLDIAMGVIRNADRVGNLTRIVNEMKRVLEHESLPNQ